MNLFDLEIGLVHAKDAPHPSHRGFADAIGADTIRCDTGNLIDNPLGEFIRGVQGFPDKYDILIAEGTRPLIALAGSKLVNSQTVIYLAGDGRIHQLNTGNERRESFYDYTKFYAGKYGSEGINSLLRLTVDGVIGVSEFSTNLTRNYLGNSIPYETAYPFIQPEVVLELKKVEPNLYSKTAVFIGNFTDYKNTNSLVQNWSKVRNTHPDATLQIVGSGHPDWIDNVEGVEKRGFVKNLSDPLSSASLYVHPAIAEAFGVSVVEAMLAGVPPIVTTMTGAKQAVEAIENATIVEPNAEELTSAIIEYFDHLPHKDQSTRSREVAEQYTEENAKIAFRDAFENIIHGL
jgi:glycosyltransferase involved in cell wall biosynthesis